MASTSCWRCYKRCGVTATCPLLWRDTVPSLLLWYRSGGSCVLVMHTCWPMPSWAARGSSCVHLMCGPSRAYHRLHTWWVTACTRPLCTAASRLQCTFAVPHVQQVACQDKELADSAEQVLAPAPGPPGAAQLSRPFVEALQ
jgi:hypothetical protein